MNLSELDDLLAFILNGNDNQSATEYGPARRLQALNAAYNREWNEIQLHVSRAAKLATFEFTWPASAQTCVVPAELQGKTVYAFYDVTVATTQPPRLIVSYRDQNTLEWYPSGPSEAKTIRAVYIPTPNKLVNPIDEPSLILPQYHELLCWSAAMWLVEIMDREASPSVWQDKYEALLLQAIKGMSNRPLGDPTTIGLAFDDLGFGDFA